MLSALLLPVRHDRFNDRRDRHDWHDAFHGLRHDPRHALHCRGRVVVRGDRIDGKIKDTVWRWVGCMMWEWQWGHRSVVHD